MHPSTQLPLIASALLALQPALADYSPPKCADFGGCYSPNNFDVHREDCTQAINWVCSANLAKTDLENEQGTGNEKRGNCNAGYAIPNLSGPRVGSKQDCINTFNAILDACGPPVGQGSKGFWGQIGVNNDSEPFFEIASGVNKDEGPNVCDGKGHPPSGPLNQQVKGGNSKASGKASSLAGSHPGRRSFEEGDSEVSKVAQEFQA